MKMSMSALFIIATVLMVVLMPKAGQFSMTGFPVKRPVSVTPVPRLNLVEIDRTFDRTDARTDSVLIMLRDVGEKMKSIDSLRRKADSLTDEGALICAAVKLRFDTGDPLTVYEADSMRVLLVTGRAFLARSDALAKIADEQLALIGAFLQKIPQATRG